MEATDLLSNPTIQEIVRQHKENKLKKQKASYNLFTISSVNSYLENFHSDIIASLLNPKGLHQEGYKFLHLFISFLNKNHDTKLVSTDFENVIVTRETGRLDIWIRDEKSRQSIIIENKINNAPDMDEQIDRYFQFAENGRQYPVQAVVYLSLDGIKKAPPVKENLGSLVKNIGAFTNEGNDLVNAWLKPCLESVAQNMDSYSVIHQYINLIKHLANKNMDTNTTENLYQFLSDNNAFETVKSITELNGKILEHRANKFNDAIKDISPFTNPYRYRPDYWIFEKFHEGENKYKLDVCFTENGSVSLVFWNEGIQTIEGRVPLTEKLQKQNLLDEFNNEVSFGNNGYHKKFVISDIYKTMVDVDNALIAFVKKLLNGLKASDKKTFNSVITN